jgi:hypothetical protein
MGRHGFLGVTAVTLAWASPCYSNARTPVPASRNAVEPGNQFPERRCSMRERAMMREEFTYYTAMAIMTLILLWGLRIVSKALEKGDQGKPLLQSVLAEEPDPQDPDTKGSFSRTAGAFGAMGLAMTTIGMGYWVLFALFFKAGDLSHLKDTWPYFLSGSALFAPYAFNQLSRIFKP